MKSVPPVDVLKGLLKSKINNWRLLIIIWTQLENVTLQTADVVNSFEVNLN